MSKFKERKESSIYNMRIFHNWVKRELVSQSKNLLSRDYGINNISILDLSCGRGSDIQKYYDNGIMNIVGFDIDDDSIREARKRYGEMIHQLKRKNVQRLPKYEFYVMDLSKKHNLEKIRDVLGNRKFDIVSCQFAIHYFFETEDTLNTFMTIVSSYINKNGFFIGTTMNGTKIREIFKGTPTIQNDIFKIVNNSDLNKIYNSKYTVELGQKTDTDHYFVNKPSEEYLVTIDELKKTGESFNLLFLGITEFSEWYKTFGKNIMSDDEKGFSFLNFSFIFASK